MTNIAFIGLGIMGSPMAVHLANAGHTVAGFNRTPERAKPLVDAGGRAAASIADAVADAEVIAVMVPDSPDVQAVLAGEGFDPGQCHAFMLDHPHDKRQLELGRGRLGQGQAQRFGRRHFTRVEFVAGHLGLAMDDRCTLRGLCAHDQSRSFLWCRAYRRHTAPVRSGHACRPAPVIGGS